MQKTCYKSEENKNIFKATAEFLKAKAEQFGAYGVSSKSLQSWHLSLFV